MSTWNINTHIVGKAYDLNQKNMNTMIQDIESLKLKLAKAIDALRCIESSALSSDIAFIANEALDELEE